MGRISLRSNLQKKRVVYQETTRDSAVPHAITTHRFEGAKGRSNCRIPVTQKAGESSKDPLQKLTLHSRMQPVHGDPVGRKTRE